ncbi:TPA: tRNA adenosine(34) deaminase TadA [Vibrio cholerae]|uniref:tRNA-specific adenosine deaminase n=5 Tax=Vibrio cholerae TaxID=666 RepID=Q9KTN7_VIBCH|nr:yfhC protein [Vibrio cholerae O1 biovar El Tor str. N16961]ABQ21577.1 zinc-binding domain protein [Vibrio cholerae O395]ACP05140.1 yfhC protein [Vibrio cholerae M66-2]ACQ61623.1 tRNA-specific adenosine-34 deaminase [Vibrio cholerae MJ-1236]ARB81445.1 tRNA adenosine(34) deaminase TadA [Vibrio cholerae]AVH51096.1 tRNA adenosine(34) deaminase TadA [Vibrio cholerae O1 biovar El Tor]EAZ73035.1 zinc-binding domain protein [Vibrio cholerae NCTC 8457]EAZ76617.1 zinc-binding domain protein [Vibrio
MSAISARITVFKNPWSVILSASLFSAQDEQFMRRAIVLAAQAEAQGEVPVGAVLVRDGEIIAEGWNGSITNHDATAHAEIEVIRKAGKALSNYRLLDTTLYVTLEPCPMCAGALLHSRVKRIVYGAPDLKAGAAGTVMDLFSSQAAYHYATVEKGLLEEECRAQLQAFFQRRRKEIKAKRDAERKNAERKNER